MRSANALPSKPQNLNLSERMCYSLSADADYDSLYDCNRGLEPIHNCDPVSISSVVTLMFQVYVVMLRRLITDDVDEKLRKDLDRIGIGIEKTKITAVY